MTFDSINVINHANSDMNRVPKLQPTRGKYSSAKFGSYLQYGTKRNRVARHRNNNKVLKVIRSSIVNTFTYKQ